MPDTPSFDLRRQHRVETPEQIALVYELAGLGSRGLAAVIDLALVGAVGLTLLGGSVWLTSHGVALPFGLLVSLFLAAAFVVYPAACEAWAGGRTLGKRIVGLRVVDESGRAASTGQAWIRNIIRIADLLPPPYLIGLAFVGLHPRHQRLGDLVAGTLVVRDRPREADARPTALPAAFPAGAPQLDDAAFALLSRFAERLPDLEAGARVRIAAALAGRLGPAAEGRDADGLLELHAAESAARAAGFRTSRDAGTAAAPWAQRRSAAWTTFEATLQGIAVKGLASLDGPALVRFAADYRSVAADLARGRTYRAPATVLDRLERMTASAHAQLYRPDTTEPRRVRTALLRSWPAAMLRQRLTIGVSFLAFLLPALAGWGAVRAQPALAEEIVDDTMRERAAAAESRTARGEKFVTIDAKDRPFMAVALISNNVRVALICFAGGIFFGIGAFVLLALNGLQLGAAAAHFANVGRLAYLGEFIVGHGPLELLAIWTAGAGGFLLGRALVAPGAWSRRDALVLAGREAGPLVGSAALLLVVAGLIEGLLSTSGSDMALRVGAAVASVLLLGLWLAGGRGAMPRRAESIASAAPASRSP